MSSICAPIASSCSRPDACNAVPLHMQRDRPCINSWRTKACSGDLCVQTRTAAMGTVSMRLQHLSSGYSARPSTCTCCSNSTVAEPLLRHACCTKNNTSHTTLPQHCFAVTAAISSIYDSHASAAGVKAAPKETRPPKNNK